MSEWYLLLLSLKFRKVFDYLGIVKTALFTLRHDILILLSSFDDMSEFLGNSGSLRLILPRAITLFSLKTLSNINCIKLVNFISIPTLRTNPTILLIITVIIVVYDILY